MTSLIMENLFDLNGITVIGSCGHWWQVADKNVALVQACPRPDCWEPPIHGFEPINAPAPADPPSWWPLSGKLWLPLHLTAWREKAL